MTTQLQNFYKTTVRSAWGSGAGNFYVSNKPIPTSGWLVISPNSATLREIVYYSAVGTDAGGDYVTISSVAHRGLGGTTAQTHEATEPIRMNLTAEHMQEISDAIDAIVAGAAADASTTTKGIARLSVTPLTTLGTATITIATPGVVTLVAHGLLVGDKVRFTTTGALPTGITASTDYYVIAAGLTADTFRISATLGGSAINTTGGQSGTHTLYRTTPVAVGNDDPRVPTVSQVASIPTSGEKSALAGAGGTPGSGNKYLTEESAKAGFKVLTAGETINGATLPVPVYQSKVDFEFYACDANDTARLKFLGFAISNGTDANPLTVQFNGIVGGFSGLTRGEKYYVQDAVGTIGLTPGTNEVLVGIAVSTTEILIHKGRRSAAGAGGSLGTASGSLPITCGFNPTVIRIYAACSSNNHISTFTGVFTNGVLTGLSTHYNEASSSDVRTDTPLLFSDSTSNFMTFSVSRTDTGFTITWTETGTFAPTDSDFFWEAEGEL